MRKYKEKLIYTVYFSVVFVFLLIVFLKIHPLVLFNADDWMYSSYDRFGIPLWGNWNPCRVLPENLMSWCTYVSVYLIMPVLRLDFVDSLIVGYGVFYSMCIMLYFVLFVQFLRKRFRLSLWNVLFVSLLFFLMHFAMLLHSPDTHINVTLFTSIHTTCYFYYAVPNLVVSALTLYLITYGFNIKGKPMVIIGLLLLWTYLSVFSDLFQTVILISLMGYRILYVFFKRIRKHRHQILPSVLYTLKNNILCCFGIALWLVSLLFEYNGGRSRSFSGYEHSTPITEVLQVFFNFFKTVNVLFWLSFVGVLVLSGILLVLHRRKKGRWDILYVRAMQCFLFCFVVVSVFEILLCARATGTFYLGRVDVLFGCCFYLLLMFSVSLVYAMHNIRQLKVVMPLYFYVFVSFTLAFSHNFYIATSGCVDYQTCREIDKHIVSQFIEADEQSLEETNIYVPYMGGETNYPLMTNSYDYPYSFGRIISDLLYKYRIIHRPIRANFEADEHLNKIFHLD